MRFGRMQAAGHDLDWLSAGPITAYAFQIAAALGEHGMPGKKHFISERSGEGSIQTNHHFGYAMLAVVSARARAPRRVSARQTQVSAPQCGTGWASDGFGASRQGKD